jgi:CoA:oxalate CoA-transferase
MSAPLDGVRVLDLSRVLAGPISGRMLSDLGADVVKVEPPDGDVTRTYGGRGGREAAYFRQQNAGKRSIVVDFATEEGCQLVRDLAARADVVLENFRPGVLARFGLGWADLSAINPRLVMMSISGFGQDGPERGRAAYAGVIHAESGVTARAPKDGGLPTDLPISMADVVTGLHGVIGVLAALRHRDATGVGQHVDVAMLDSMMVCDDFAPDALDDQRRAREEAAAGGGERVRARRPTRSEMIDAPGGPMIVMGEFKWIWKSIHERAGVADPTPPGADLDTKIAARYAAWREWIASFATREELTKALDTANLAWGNVASTARAAAGPTATHRGTIVEIGDPLGAYSVVQSPWRFSNATTGVRGPAPRQGEHRDDIIRDWLG